MADWRKWTDDDEVQSGDIVETVTKIPDSFPFGSGLKVAFIKHYGIVVFIDGKPNLLHNIIGSKPTIMPMEDVFKDRKIHRVLRTGLSDCEIMKKYDECKDECYRLFSWNCESLMVYIYGNPIGYPQQKGWTIGLSLTSIIIILLLLLILFKKCE